MKTMNNTIALAAALLIGGAAQAADWFPLPVNSTGADDLTASASCVALGQAAQPGGIRASFLHQ